MQILLFLVEVYSYQYIQREQYTISQLRWKLNCDSGEISVAAYSPRIRICIADRTDKFFATQATRSYIEYYVDWMC